jgi:hypothetical protein
MGFHRIGKKPNDGSSEFCVAIPRSKSITNTDLSGTRGVAPPNPDCSILVTDPRKRKNPPIITRAVPKTTAAKVLKKSFIPVGFLIFTKVTIIFATSYVKNSTYIFLYPDDRYLYHRICGIVRTSLSS